MLGAGRWTVTRRITLPLVAPAITGGALLAAVDSMALFGPQAFLGLPAQIVFLPTRIYGLLGSYPPRWGDASALSLILVLLTVVGLVIQRGYLERRSFVTIERPRRAHPAHPARPVEVAAARVLPAGRVLQRDRARSRCSTAAAFSESWIEPLSARQPHARALPGRPVRGPGRGARHRQQLHARDRRRA